MSNTQSIAQNNVKSDQLNTDELLEAMDKVIEKEMKENHIPGMGLVIVQNGKTIYKKGYGIANMATAAIVDPDKTIFRIGSISKALTFLTLSKLIDQGRIGMDDDVSKYFDGIDNSLGFKDPVTIKNLLTHTSGFDQIGIGRHIYDFERSIAERKAQRPSISEFLKNKNLRRVTKAGQYYRYDTYGTTLAGAIIEKVTGLPYDQAMKQELFDLLGMDRSSVEVENKYIEDLATGHGYNEGQYEVMPYEIYNTTPASSIDASPADMGRLLEALTGDGANKSGRLFSSDMITNIRNGLYKSHPEFVGMSYGMHESNYVGALPDAYKIKTIGHGGDMLGTSSLMTTIPSLNMGIFVSANRNSEAGGERINLWRLVMPVILKHYKIEKAKPFSIPKPVNVTLDEYVGNYYLGIFCHSCTEDEFDQYAWRRSSRPRMIRKMDNTLLLGEDTYIPRGNDVFVRADGNEQVYFGRDESGKITYFVFSDELNSYERIDD